MVAPICAANVCTQMHSRCTVSVYPARTGTAERGIGIGRGTNAGSPMDSEQVLIMRLSSWDLELYSSMKNREEVFQVLIFEGGRWKGTKVPHLVRSSRNGAASRYSCVADGQVLKGVQQRGMLPPHPLPSYAPTLSLLAALKQMRETRREQLAALRSKFEQDKARVAKMKEQRKFRPF